MAATGRVTQLFVVCRRGLVPQSQGRRALHASSGKPAAAAAALKYPEWEDGFCVRPLKKEELGWVAKASQFVRDPTGKDDAEIMYMAVDPEPGSNFFAGVYKGRLVGSAFFPECSPGTYFGSGSVVLPEFFKQCYRRLRRSGQYYGCIKNESQPGRHEPEKRRVFATINDKIAREMLVDDYRHLWNLAIFIGNVPRGENLPDGILRADEISFEKIIAYDNKVYLEPNVPTRRRLLAHWLQITDGASYVATNEEGDVIGYACRRPSNKNGLHHAGPVYAESLDVAEKLTLALGHDLPEADRLIYECYEPNSAAMRLMAKYGFKKDHTLEMMVWGDPLDVYKPQVFSVTSSNVCAF